MSLFVLAIAIFTHTPQYLCNNFFNSFIFKHPIKLLKSSFKLQVLCPITYIYISNNSHLNYHYNMRILQAVLILYERIEFEINFNIVNIRDK